MPASRKRSRAHFNGVQDEDEDSGEKQMPMSKVKKTYGWDSIRPSSGKCYVGLSELKAHNRDSREKDIYDFSSSEHEEDGKVFKKRKIGSNDQKFGSVKRLTSSLPKIPAKNSSSHDAKDLKSASKEHINGGVFPDVTRHTSFAHNENTESLVTPCLPGKKVPVVEIYSSGSSKASKSQKTKNTSKLDRRAQLIEEMKRDSNPRKLDSLPIKKKRGRQELGSDSVVIGEITTSVAERLMPSMSRSKSTLGKLKNKSSKLMEPPRDSLKSILSPHKSKTSELKKKVNFQDKEELDFGFKDLPTTVSAKKLQKTQTSYEASTGLLEEDDTACEVCGRFDSKKKNPMLLCDGCDSGYHIKCIGLSKEPESEQWFCHKCSIDVVPKRIDDLVHLKSPKAAPNIPNFEHHLKYQQRIIIDKLTGKRPVKLKGLDEEMKKVYQVVEQTVIAGEGNSMLIIGSRGTGKTTLVNYVISDISNRHPDSFHVIRLNGFIHTDDKLALKEIWRQLGREMRVEDGPNGKPSNYADTMVSLLALLSHPSEISEAESDQTTMSVIFILDEFDHFTTHHRQTLLYNLFDIAQSKKAPIAVLGLTTKIDVAEMLEKRVKSRFSHRYIHFSLPRSLPAFWEICKEGLTVTSDEAEEYNDYKDHDFIGRKDFISFWKAMIDVNGLQTLIVLEYNTNSLQDLYTKDAAFLRHLQSIFYQSKSVPVFFSSCILPVANLSPQNPFVHGGNFCSSEMLLAEPDSKLHLLQGLSELELALLIAACRLDVILDTDTCNFAMAYEEYCSLTSKHKIQTSSTGVTAIGASAKVWGREVSLEAWEKLTKYELLVPVAVGANNGRDYGFAGRMWKIDVGLEEIPGSVEGLSGIMTKWCREI